MALLTCLAVLSAFGVAVAQDGVLGVGGFISPSPQLAEARSAAGLSRPDLSAVTVELRTASGVKLHTSDCAPNGYYFIPVSELGSYKLHVASPEGWTFAPAEAVVVCSKDNCAENKDVNFVFTGFQVQGNILGAGKADSCGLKSEAPSGVRVTITSDKDPKTTQTVESKSGHFTFTNLFPGSYKFSAFHPDFDIAPKLLSAEVGYDALTLPETFGITGYKLTGLVTSSSGAVAGVQVLLYSTEALELGCSGSAATGPALNGKHLLCSAVTDSEGKYEFNGVHCAKYTLLPLHTDTEAGFEIQPSSQDAVVQQGHLEVKQAFRVTGFAVTGRVVMGSGSGLADVAVLLNGKPVARTDASGVYKVSSLEAGTYTITAQAADFDFAALTDIAITPGLKQLPDITIERVSASGSVSFTDPSFAARPRLLTLSSEDGTYSQRISTTNGAFSVKLPPGKYRLAPVVLPEEKSRGLVLSPTYRDVTLADEPVSSLHFTQARFAIHGAVKCLGAPCDGKLRLRVVAEKYDEQMLLEEVSELAATEDGTIRFKLDEMVPLGTYSISVLEPTFCWEQEVVQVSLTSRDETAPTLVQKGFTAKVSASHPATLKATSAAGDISTYELAAGAAQSVCLPGAGIFTLALESTCFFFGKEPLQYDTSNTSPAVVEFTRGQAVVQGELHSVDTQVSEVSLELRNAAGRTVSAQATADPGKPGVFRYQFVTDLEAEIQLQPKVVGALSYPKRQTVRVLAKSCTPPVPVFSLKSGLFLDGAVQPAVEGVTVTVKYKGWSAAGEVGEPGQVQGTYLTGADGKFRVGPLYDDVEYDVSVEKTGYRFSAASSAPAEGGYIFTGEKLASVTVHVDLASALDKGLVLLSFSGDRGFRKNAKLGKDGTHTFYDMLPGTYYLRPQLREYQFEPAVAEVVVQDGGEHVVDFGSKRTAYSIMGTTRTVNGQVLAGVVVEAKLNGVVKESSISAEDGSYRIHGLSPGQAYSVGVRPTATVLRAFPAQQPVEMGAADMVGVDFSTFPSASQLVVSGAVDIAEALLSNAWVQVIHVETQQRVASVALDASRYYQVKVSQPGQYILRVVTSLPEDAYTSSEVSVQITNEPVQAARLSLVQVSRHRADVEALTTSLAMPIVAAALIVGLAVWKKDFLAEVLQVGPALSKPGGESNDAEWLTTSTLSKRRNGSGSLAAAALTATTTADTTFTEPSTTTTTVTQRRASRIT